MTLVFHLINALKVLVIADAVFSWVVAPDAFPRSFTRSLLDPVYAPLRELMPPMPIDFAPLVALAVLFGLEALLKRSGNRAPR